VHRQLPVELREALVNVVGGDMQDGVHVQNDAMPASLCRQADADN
jgi:hypothetical protein